MTNKGNWITSIAALHGNPFDGHTLNETVLRSENVSGVKVKEVYVDRGYRGHDYVGDAQVYKQGGRLKRLTRAIKHKLKRRGAIEPTIGHLKTDNRMSRNFLKGAEGDRINAILAAAGYNMRKLIAAFLYALIKLGYFLRNRLFKIRRYLSKSYLTLAD